MLGLIADIFVDHRHLPWRPLDVEAPIGLATGTKITLLAIGPSDKCFAKLDEAKTLEYVRARPKHEGATCGYDKAALFSKSVGANFRPAREVSAQCALALAGYIWLKQVDEHAREILGSPVKTVYHAGTYSCRRQKGNSSGAWSEHAFANAWDITGFKLEDGRVISVLKDWNQTDYKLSPKERLARQTFLRKTRNTACRLFRVVLSPDYNAAHKDHLHFDQGPNLSCR